MNKKEIIESTAQFVSDYMRDKEAGHNWWHIDRVRHNAMEIFGLERRGDPFVIELAALVHDIGDRKIDPGSDGRAIVERFLHSRETPVEIIGQVSSIMGAISFRDNIGKVHARSPELDIVQDADRLDAIGAVGIARAFSFGGSAGNEIYVPGRSPVAYSSAAEYNNSGSSTINHFYEKLLKLKELMNTDAGRRLAEERHAFMLTFLDQFYRETGYSKPG